LDQALSIKQPWAAMVVHGFKTIEIRRWSTRHRGRVLIHAARISDSRPESWARLPRHCEDAARLGGGIVGEAELVECRVYKTREAFARDRLLHLNEPSWFQAPAMYGFVFADAKPLPFRRFTGSLYFFNVPSPPVRVQRGLLVSVRSAAEASAALHGGASVIDIKEPRRGPLGRASNEVIAEVVGLVKGRRLVSAALGELAEFRDARTPPGLSFVKCGLANLGRTRGWQRQLLALRDRLSHQENPPELVTVAYADWKNAAAPPWQQVANFALRQKSGVLLVDTFEKKWRTSGKRRLPTSLLDWLTADEIRHLCQRCQAAGVRIALAGSLRVRHILKFLDSPPTWFAVRGAVCEANKRDGEVHVLKVRDLGHLLTWHGFD
jgi:(5-formylfuran-3-yl)methyl phosphate synthase